MSYLQPLDSAQRRRLSRALGDRPTTVFSLHVARTGDGDAFVIGEPDSFRGAVVQWNEMPDEPEGWGEADAVWSILRELDGWTCILVTKDQAPRTAVLMEQHTRSRPRFLDDIQYVLPAAPAQVENEVIRVVTEADLPLEGAADLWRRGGDVPSRLVRDGILVCAFDGDRVVGQAGSLARSDRYADVGVSVLEPYRERGLATAAASLVCGILLSQGLTPVWSTGETNAPSRRVAEKLGFVEVGRRTYVIA